MRAVRLVLDENEFGIALDVTCRSTSLPYEDPVEVTRADGRLVSERITYELTGKCEGWVEVGGERIVLDRGSDSFFRNHSWGYQPGRGGPRLYTAPGGPRRRAPGVRQWVLFDMPGYGGFYFIDPSGRRASGKGALLYPDRIVPVTSVEHELDFHEGGRRLRSGRFTLTDADGASRSYEVTDLGWVYCQGGGYFGGFDDGLGPGRLPRRRARRGRGLGRLAPDADRHAGRARVRVRARLGRELHPAGQRRRDRARPLRMRGGRSDGRVRHRADARSRRAAAICGPDRRRARAAPRRATTSRSRTCSTTCTSR